MTGQRREVREEVTWPNIVQWKQQIRANKVQEKHRKHISLIPGWVFAAVASNSRWLETAGILRVLIWRQMVPSLEICDGATLCSKTAKIVQSRCTNPILKTSKIQTLQWNGWTPTLSKNVIFPYLLLPRICRESSGQSVQCARPDKSLGSCLKAVKRGIPPTR